MKNWSLFFILFTVTPGWVWGQLKNPKEFFPDKRPQVLIVGSVHLDYPGLDAHITDPSQEIDVLKEPNKSELNELIDYLLNFNPNKIAIEAFPGWKATEKLREYKNGKYKDKRGESFQIGMRMAALLDLDTLYSIDASSLTEDLMKLDSTFTDDLFEDYDFISDDPFSKIYKEWYTYLDHLILEMDLLSYYKLINSEEYHNYYNGHYLLGDFNLDTHRGADALAVYWINRNLRMFRNIQNLVSDDQDRILVVVGNGHAALLRYLFQWSPEFRYVDFNDIEIKSIDHDTQKTNKTK